MIMVSNGVDSVAHSRRTIVGILSGPLALCGFKPCSNLRTPPSLMCICGMMLAVSSSAWSFIRNVLCVFLGEDRFILVVEYLCLSLGVSY